MVQLVLEGDTLGKRQQHYNEHLKRLFKETLILEKLNNEDNDLDNLLKIDVASNKRDVEYILEVLRSEDMLYVSRAIRRCVWLITEPQYAHIVNPDYLYMQLFPQMTTKASNKLLFHVRLNLKEPARVESFYNYCYENKNKKAALKWLPHCSLAFIEKEIEKLSYQINLPLLKRLSGRSITILEKSINKSGFHCKKEVLKATMFLINTCPENYLDIVQTMERYDIPHFNAKFTSIIMKNCPDKILRNFTKYYDRIDLPSFCKYLKKVGEDIIPFLTKYVNNESMRSWFRFDILKHFIKHMPEEGRFDFLKNVFIDKSYKVDGNTDGIEQLCCLMSSNNSHDLDHNYDWYRFAPFEVAFPDLKKMIRNESSPNERNAILEVMISCACRDAHQIHTLLEYYHDKFINEPFKFKIQFVNNVILHTDTHKFDEKSWNILNNIFCSLEVYTESKSNVQSCIQAILVYKILHHQRVPEIIEKKYTFATMKSVQQKLNTEERDEIFIYLYNILVNRVQQTNIQKDAEFVTVLHLVDDILNLLLDWKRELLDYPWVLNTIKKLVKTRHDNTWTIDLSRLYDKNKLWRKHMFEDSLLLSPTEEVCINALKHNPELLKEHKSEVGEICRNDELSLKHFLTKIRIYWPESLANEWIEMYIGKLDSKGGHKALVRGLCALLPQKQFVDIVKKYAPMETKIVWSENDDLRLSLRKHFAKSMYLARPLPPLDVVLLYAHGDYLQFALPSLNATLYNMSASRSREHIKMFLDAPVSLQKHAIRYAFTKLNSPELKQIFSDIWNSTKNSTIRAVLFKQTFYRLCGEKDPAMREEIWDLLNMFIDNLSQDEDKRIYDTMDKVQNVPLPIRAKFCIKTYKYLKSLPIKADCEGVIQRIVQSTADIMDVIDGDFIADILLDFIDKKFTTERYSYVYNYVISSYLLSAKDAKSQSQRYVKVLVPLLERTFELWKYKNTYGSYFFRDHLEALLKQICGDIRKHVFEKDMVFPVKMFSDILNILEDKLPVHNNYVMLRTWKLTVTYVKVLEEHKSLISTIRGDISTTQRARDDYCTSACGTPWDQVYLNVAPDFSEICLKYLKEDMETLFPSIYLLFADALKYLFHNINVGQTIYLDTLKSVLKRKDFIEGYLMVLKALPDYLSDDKETKKLEELRKIICSHPSVEVKTHYYQAYKNCDLENICLTF